MFGKPLQLPGSNQGNESADELDLSEADADDNETSLPLAVEAQEKPTKMRRKKKRKSIAKIDSTEDNEVLGGAPAWEDPDDATLEVDLTLRNRTKKLRRYDDEVAVSGAEYERRLRDQFVKLHGTAGWAEKRPGVRDDDASSDSEEDVGVSELTATSARPIADSASRGLRPTQIDIKCLQRVEIPALASEKTASEKVVSDKAAVVQSLQFHPDSELMLTAGLDKTLRIFSVDGTENAKVASYFFRKFPITGAAFTPNGDQVLLTGRGFKMWGLDVRTGEPMHIKHHTPLQHEKYSGLITGPCPSDAPALRANQITQSSATRVLCSCATCHQSSRFARCE